MNNARQEHIERDNKRIQIIETLVFEASEQFNLSTDLTKAIRDYLCMELDECRSIHATPEDLVKACEHRDMLQRQRELMVKFRDGVEEDSIQRHAADSTLLNLDSAIADVESAITGMQEELEERTGTEETYGAKG